MMLVLTQMMRAAVNKRLTALLKMLNQFLLLIYRKRHVLCV